MNKKTRLNTQTFVTIFYVTIQSEHLYSLIYCLIYIEKYKIEPAEMRFLRSMAGYILWDKKRNSDIREQLGIFIINDKLTQYKIDWREHIQRMDDNRLIKTYLDGERVK